MSFTLWTAHAGLALVVTAMVFALPRLRTAGAPSMFGMIALVAALEVAWSLHPAWTVTPLGWLRSMIGDPSVTLVMIAMGALVGRWRGAPALAGTDARMLARSVAAGALVLYPMTLGLTLTDPYRWGFGQPWFVALVILIALVAWMRSCTWTALTLALAVLAWALRWYESTNLWDYLIDPIVAVLALGRVGAAIFRSARQRGRAPRHASSGRSTP